MNQNLAPRALALLKQQAAGQEHDDEQVNTTVRILAAIPVSPYENVGQALARAGRDPSAELLALAALSAILPYHPELTHVLSLLPSAPLEQSPAAAASTVSARTRRTVIAALAAAVALIIALVLANTGGSGGWPPQDQAGFMSSCTETSGGDSAICGCVLLKLESQYTAAQAQAIEEQMEQTGQEPSGFAQVAQADIAACS